MTDSKTPNKISRRGFLIAMTGSALAVAAACSPSSAQIPTPYVPGRGPLPTGTPQPKITPVAEGTALPDPQWGKVTFDKMILTDVEQLYITQYDYNNTPEVDAAAWNLKVDGLVENPFNLTLDDIKALPVYEDIRALECISDPVGGNLIGNMTWKGIHFEEILKRANLKSTVNHVRFEAADGYSTSVTLDWMTQPNVMLAYEMNGKPLTTVHGFPLRLHIPGLYGQKMPRWLTHIEFIDHEFTGFWESRGWSNTAGIRTRATIVSPEDRGTVTPGAAVVIQGVATAGKRKIVKVEIQIEGGEWMPAQLIHGPSQLAWTQWYFTWTVPAPGGYRIAARATDDSGFVQTNMPGGLFGDAFPDGTDAIHQISLQTA